MISSSTEIVNVDVAPALTTVGLRARATSPVGGDITAVRLIGSAVPVIGAVLIVIVPKVPWTMERLLGNAKIEKSEGARVTVTVTDVLCVIAPSVPVTVSV